MGGMIGGTTGKWMEAGGTGLQAGGGAGMTATMMGMGGPAALGIGVAVGALAAMSKLTTASEQAAAAIQKMAEHFEEAYKTAH